MLVPRHALPCAVALALALAACASTERGGPVPSDRVTAPPPPITAPWDGELTNARWVWQDMQRADGTKVVSDTPDRYTLLFLPSGRIEVRADCNRGAGSYRMEGSALSIGPIALTRTACPEGSRDAEFMKALAAVAKQSTSGQELVLTLSGNAGTMRFTTPRK